jgi:hypothetical protein
MFMSKNKFLMCLQEIKLLQCHLMFGLLMQSLVSPGNAFSFIAKIYLNLYSSYFSRVSFIESVIFVKLKCIVNKENQCYDLPIKIITYSGI